MKNDTTLWIVLVGVVAVIAVGVWLLNQQPTPEILPGPTTTGTTPTPVVKTPAKTTTKTTTTAPKATYVPVSDIKLSGQDTLQHLLTMKDNNYSCSLSTVAPSPAHSGTLYLSGTKARINLTNGVSMVEDSTYIYTWKAGQDGLRVLANLSVAGSLIVSYGGIDPWSSISVKCSPWTPDASKFTPAAGTYYDGAGMKVQ